MHAEFALRLALVAVFDRLRARDGMNYADLAGHLEISESQMSRLVNGGLAPSLRLLLQFEDIEPGIASEIFSRYREIARDHVVAGYRATRTSAARAAAGRTEHP